MRQQTHRLLVFAHLYWQAVFYLVPLVLLFAISFWTLKNYQLVPAFNTQNYRTVLSGGVYLKSFGISFWLAGTTALLAATFALPLSQAISFHIRGRLRLFVIFVLFLPFFSSYTIRTFSWQLWLSNSGVIASGLRKLGLLAVTCPPFLVQS